MTFESYRVTLGDVVKERNERCKDPQESEYDYFIGLEHLDTGRLEVLRHGSTNDVTTGCKICHKGDVLFGRRNPYLRRASIINYDATCSGDIIVLIPDDSIIVPKYLPIVLTSKIFWEQAMSKQGGTMSKRVHMEDLAKYEFDLPSIDYQKKIVELIWSLESLIRVTSDQKNDLDLLIKSRFIEMFENSNIVKKTLSDCCNFIDYRGKTPKKSDNGIPLITAKNVKENQFSWESREYVPIDNYDLIMTRGIPKINDVLFTTEAPLGNVCRIPNINGKFCVGQRIITLQSKGEIIPEYLEHALLSNAFRSQMFSKVSGSTVKGIRSAELEKLEIPVPDLVIQKQFADFLKQVDKSKFELQKYIDELKSLQLTIINNPKVCGRDAK